MKSTLQVSISKYGSALILLSFIVLFFLGCSPENFAPETSSQKIEIKYLNEDELKTHRQEYQRLLEVKNSLSVKAASATNRMVHDSIYKFDIDIDRVLYISAGNYRYYTYAIQREGSKKMENLVITFNERDQYRLAIVKYDFNEEEIAALFNGTSIDITGRAEVEILNQEEGVPCYQIIRVRSFTRIPGQIEFSEIIIVEVPCPPDSGNTGPGGPGTGGSTGSSGSGWSYGGPATGWPVSGGPPGSIGPNPGSGGGSGGGTTGPSEITPSDNSLLTAPLLPPVYFPDRDHRKNCTKLKAMVNNANIKAALVDLKGKISANDEYGYKLIKQPTYNSCAPLPPGNGNKIGFHAGNKIYGGLHSHFDGLTPMFSAEDIHALYKIMQHFNYTVESQDDMIPEFVLTVATTQGTYALKIDSIDFLTEMNYIMNNIKEREFFYTNLENSQLDRPKTDAPEKQQRDFLNFINALNLSISLYKTNDDFTEWTKLTADPDNVTKVKTQNCP